MSEVGENSGTAAGRPSLCGRDVRRIHCVGVGGMGVAPLAIHLARAGFAVSGEDDALTDEVRTLLDQAGVAIGALPDACDLLAYSSAISAGHPTRLAATARSVKQIRRGELLAEIVRGRKLVAVCGSHGKTTTSAMLATALRAAEFPAGYVLGGLPADGSSPAEAGAGEWVVAEIDESDGTIGAFSPEITVAVNLDWDHPEHYRRAEDLERAFAELFARTRGTVLIHEACAMSARIRASAREAATFGPAGDFRGDVAVEAASRMTLSLGGRFALREAEVRARGAFNAANATAALAAAQLMGAAMSPALLAGYAGMRRRQTVLHAAGGVTVIEDYAHHPTEIRALLASLRGRVTDGGRLVVVFQPHRFSRTAQFKADFAAALAAADRLHLLDVYPAGEAPIAGGTTADVLAEIARAGAGPAVTHHGASAENLCAALTTETKAGDLIAFVGAGDIDRRAREWLATFTMAATPTRWETWMITLRPLLSPATKLRGEEPLATKTTMRLGGAARVYAEPANLPDLQALLRGAAEAGIPVFVLGRGSNLVVPDEGVDGVVISLVHEAWSTFEERPEGRVWAGAGLRLKNLCGLAAKAGLGGFEFLEGIPGSVGGALRMNAGAMGGWMFDVVEEVALITLAGEVKTLPKAAMHVDYRHCAELRDAIALGALLRPAAAAEAAVVKRQMDAYAKKRHESQPREPSAGCIFKNPPGSSAGRLIDETGLKGMRVGDAEVSTVHANFIVNRGQATATDVIELVRRVRARVREAKGVELEPEVLLYGRNWRDVL